MHSIVSGMQKLHPGHTFIRNPVRKFVDTIPGVIARPQSLAHLRCHNRQLAAKMPTNRRRTNIDRNRFAH